MVLYSAPYPKSFIYPSFILLRLLMRAGIVQSVYRLTAVCPIGVRLPVVQAFSLHLVHTGCGVDQASNSMGSAELFPGGKAAGA
jgi:hypothetical protein